MSAAIEAAADQPFLTFMREQIFQPLGMDDTGAESSTEENPDHVGEPAEDAPFLTFFRQVILEPLGMGGTKARSAPWVKPFDDSVAVLRQHFNLLLKQNRSAPETFRLTSARRSSGGVSMATEYKGVPAGASTIIPRLYCRDVDAQIAFCEETFGAVASVRRPGPDGRTAHAMLLFGSAMLMLEAESPALPGRAPGPDGSSPVVLYLYVEDVDRTVKRGLERGAALVVPIETQFWGDRIGWLRDPAGHLWTIATRVEETSEDQRRERSSRRLSTS